MAKKRISVVQVTLTVNVPYTELDQVAPAGKRAAEVATEMATLIEGDASHKDIVIQVKKPDLVHIEAEVTA